MENLQWNFLLQLFFWGFFILLREYFLSEQTWNTYLRLLFCFYLHCQQIVGLNPILWSPRRCYCLFTIWKFSVLILLSLVALFLIISVFPVLYFISFVSLRFITYIVYICTYILIRQSILSNNYMQHSQIFRMFSVFNLLEVPFSLHGRLDIQKLSTSKTLFGPLGSHLTGKIWILSCWCLIGSQTWGKWRGRPF